MRAMSKEIATLFSLEHSEGEERSDLLGRVFCCSELGECNEGDVVRVGIGVTGFREVLDRLVYRLALNCDVLVLGVAMLKITRENLDYIGRVVKCRNLEEFAF